MLRYRTVHFSSFQFISIDRSCNWWPSNWILQLWLQYNIKYVLKMVKDHNCKFSWLKATRKISASFKEFQSYITCSSKPCIASINGYKNRCTFLNEVKLYRIITYSFSSMMFETIKIILLLTLSKVQMKSCLQWFWKTVRSSTYTHSSFAKSL